ncbi:MAG: hypothetical protein WCY62_05110 [Clostridia bacterium]|jgi:pilus assembly protein TadC
MSIILCDVIIPPFTYVLVALPIIFGALILVAVSILIYRAVKKKSKEKAEQGKEVNKF